MIDFNPTEGAIAALAPLLDENASIEALTRAVASAITNLAIDPELELAKYLAASSVMWRKTADSLLSHANAASALDERKQFFAMAERASVHARDDLKALAELKIKFRGMRDYQPEAPSDKALSLIKDPRYQSQMIRARLANPMISWLTKAEREEWEQKVALLIAIHLAHEKYIDIPNDLPPLPEIVFQRQQNALRRFLEVPVIP